ncbi:hypothetical protein ACFY8B_01865 [Streptomyces sp. NPDC012751]|uniref:hypothetical protein n=1 Tax=unclassified Streptomyces TaxID=2593676 RepID=UPI0009A0F0A9|nr:hypothetical protein [Streptomyces sp. NRRL S-31]
MTRERSRRRLRRRDRNALIAASLTALSLTASGCVVVHGEREVLPAATRAEAVKALTAFTDAYNKADKAYDSSVDAPYVTGALADIDSARLRAGHVNSPSGNARHTPLTLTDVKITIVEKAGWPRWFVADARGNKAGDYRWVLVFTRGDLGERWRVAYLTLMAPGTVPEFETDRDGRAAAVPAGSTRLAVRPDELSKTYAAYLKNGGKTFADGRNTSGLRADRARAAEKPGLVRQYIDEPLTHGDYAPLALRTADGGALVFFSTHHYEKQTAYKGATVPVTNQDVRALIKGDVKQNLTLESVANQAVLDPAGSGPVRMLGRVQGLTSAQGG